MNTTQRHNNPGIRPSTWAAWEPREDTLAARINAAREQLARSGMKAKLAAKVI